MAEQGVDILRRKVGRRDAPVAPPADGALALSLALARAAQDQARLPFVVDGALLRPTTLAEVVEIIPEQALIALLDRADGAGSAVFVMSQPVMAGLIEAITTGLLGSAPAAPRRPTRTDAAILARFMDAALAGSGALAEGWRYAAHLAEARPLGLLLEEGDYTLWQGEARLGTGGRGGPIWLVLPARPAEPAAPPQAEGDDFAQDLSTRIGEAEARLDAVLARTALTLSQIMALMPGDMLPLGTATLDSVRLTGVDGRVIGEGRLGQMRGMRALRLSQDLRGDGADPPARIAG